MEFIKANNDLIGCGLVLWPADLNTVFLPMEGWLAHRSVLKSRQSFVTVLKGKKKNASNSDIFKFLPIPNFCNIQVSCSWSVVSQIKRMLFNACHLDCKNKGKHLDLLVLVYVNCVHNI